MRFEIRSPHFYMQLPQLLLAQIIKIKDKIKLAIFLSVSYFSIRMNSKNRKTFNEIFQEPVRSDINYFDIVNLFKALGAEVSQGSGSRIRVALNGVRAVFHSPHPKKVTDKGAIKSVRRFLLTAGVKK